MKHKIYFRADADEKIGYGHFIRTLALAEMLRDDFDCTFFSASPSDFQRDEAKKICRLEELPAGEEKFNVFLEKISGEEIVFLDNYFFTPEYEKQIKDKGCNLVVLAPSKPRHYADIVINYVDTNPANYSVEKYTMIVAGLEWAILRDPFRRPIEEKNRKKGSVAVSFGGTDRYCLLEKVVDTLKVDKWNLSVLCTSRVSETRRKLLQNKGVNLHVDIKAEEVARLFEETEYAILSSSMICLEALSRGAKVLAGYYVDNQEAFYHILMDEHCITGLGNLLHPDSFWDLRIKMKGSSGHNRLPIDFSVQKDRYVSLFKSLC